MERRRFLGALLAASAGPLVKESVGGSQAVASLPGQSSRKSEFPQNSAIVLTHAAWADGSCWSNIVARLERHGLQVICAPIPLTSLTNDATALMWTLERTKGPVVQRALAQKASPEQARIAAAMQRPIAVQCIQEAAPVPGWKTKPSWYLIAEDDRMINPKSQRFMADRMGAKIHSAPVDHTAMYASP
jgi:hypothetical protein